MKNIGIKIIVLLIILLFIVFFFAYFIFFSSKIKNTSLSDNNDIAETVQVKPTETTVLNDTKVELVDYRVYKSDKIDFNFIIAKVRITSNESTNINLNNFKTSEDITLDNVDTFVSKLEEKSFFLGKENVVFSLVSNEKQYFANIFIPITDKKLSSIKVLNNINNSEFNFNLNSKIGSVNLLKYEADDLITDGKTYQMKVSSAFSITGSYMSETINGNTSEYLLPSTVEVYSFNLEAISLWGDEVIIESAEYETDKGDKFEALNSSINSEKYENIIDRKIIDKDKGSLFFVAYNPVDNPITYKGVLKLKVKGSNSWIIINVDLN